MAIVKASYTKRRAGAKAAIRYIQHRPGKDGRKVTRTLFGSDGVMGRQQAYGMLDAAAKGTVFFRLVISPDPTHEDTHQDLHLWELTEHTMLQLEECLQTKVAYVAVEHTDHAPHRHVHVVALVAGKLTTQDLQALRRAATDAAVVQRNARDLAQEQHAREWEEAEWER
jgi:hypothetical protein